MNMDAAVTTKREDLVQFGAAPGMYFFVCKSCEGTGLGAKRSQRCEPCAIQELERDRHYDSQFWQRIKDRATD